MNQILLYFQNNSDTFLTYLQEHVYISLISITVAMAIGIPAGYLASKTKRYERYVTGVFQVLRVIPSLALLILLIPIMGTGVKPAVTALTALAIPPVLINTTNGFKGVSPFILETAEGMGMTPGQILWRVRFPLAMPMISTGIKTAMIEIIASATIAAKIGAGGLGSIIVTGLGLNRSDLLIIGGVSVAVLSLTAGIILNGLDRLILKYQYIGK